MVERSDTSVLVPVSAAHLISHIYMLAIPALLPLLPERLDASFIELGAAVSVFNIMSALLQAPMGFVVDRLGAWRVLGAGIGLGAAACGLFAAFPSYRGLLLLAGALGVANAVYHPANYAILSRSIRESAMGRAFSFHGFAGFAGFAVTPFLLTTIMVARGLSAAFITLGVLGAAMLVFLFATRPAEENAKMGAAPRGKDAGFPGAATVFSLPIALLFITFMLLSLSTTSLERFSVSALIQGFDVSLPLANTALTAFLACSAVGVLSGGILADRTRRHGFVAAASFAGAAVLTAIVAAFPLPAIALVTVFALIGFLTGVIVPSRDMLVRAASPKGGEGKTFGIVSTGFNVSGTMGPLLCGYFLDHGMPSFVFWAAVCFMLMTVAMTVLHEMRSGARRQSHIG